MIEDNSCVIYGAGGYIPITSLLTQPKATPTTENTEIDP